MDYIDKERQKLIPQGGIVPQPRVWKGRKPQLGNNKHILVPKNFTPNAFYKKYPGKSKVAMNGISHRRLTTKQIKTAQFLLQGYSKRQAMIHAGYTLQTASKKRLSDQKTLVSFLEDIRTKFEKDGITETYVSKKMKEWFEAKKSIYNMREGVRIAQEPDYQTQIAAFKEWKTIALPKETNNEQGKKREITLTEWITDATPASEVK